jgi:hypothetical protein
MPENDNRISSAAAFWAAILSSADDGLGSKAIEA